MDQTIWVEVPQNAIIHVDDIALYYLNPEQFEAVIELPDFFSKHALQLAPSTITQIQFEGSQTIDLTPVDEVLKEIASREGAPIQPITYSWSASDTVLAIGVSLGYVFVFILAYLYAKRGNALQCQIDRHGRALARFKKQDSRLTSMTTIETRDRDSLQRNLDALVEMDTSSL